MTSQIGRRCTLHPDLTTLLTDFWGTSRTPPANLQSRSVVSEVWKWWIKSNTGMIWQLAQLLPLNTGAPGRLENNISSIIPLIQEGNALREVLLQWWANFYWNPLSQFALTRCCISSVEVHFECCTCAILPTWNTKDVGYWLYESALVQTEVRTIPTFWLKLTDRQKVIHMCPLYIGTGWFKHISLNQLFQCSALLHYFMDTSRNFS